MIYLIYFLRLCVLGLVLWPVLSPTVSVSHGSHRVERVTVFFDSSHLSLSQRVQVQAKIHEAFGHDVDVSLQRFGDSLFSPQRDLANLLDKLSSVKGKVVILSKANVFGPHWESLAQEIKHSKPFLENRLTFLNENELFAQGSFSPFLLISDVYLPSVVFVNQTSHAVVTLIGKGIPHSVWHVTLQLKNDVSYLNSKQVDISVPESGNILQHVDVPVQFFEVGSQYLFAQIATQPKVSSAPLNQAFVPVSVAYQHTSILHLSYSPDFNLRMWRSKMKFWPNLDVISYTILRDMESEQNVAPQELSLIEFPSQKLFGERLSKVHGVLAQNFAFDRFLRQGEVKSLVSYIHQGGRLVLQGGPETFQDQSQAVQSLSPCENRPTWDEERVYHWQFNPRDAFLSPTLAEAFPYLESSSTARGCRPKNGVLVLATLRETGDPVLLAMPLEKGLVLTFLGEDWFTSFVRDGVGSSVRDRSQRVEKANASETVFQWMLEFLQRRQDGALRPPMLAGPRLYLDDVFLAVKSRGGLNPHDVFLLKSKGDEALPGRPWRYGLSGLEEISLESPLSELLGGQRPSSHIPLALTAKQSALKPMVIKNLPVFSGQQKQVETNSNPWLYEGVPSIYQKISGSEKINDKTKNNKPLIEVYPFLLALALGLLALEQGLRVIFL
jgi:hypothetical protein